LWSGFSSGPAPTRPALCSTANYATRYEIELRRLPAYEDDSPEEYQAMIAELDEGPETLAAANAAGFRYFTDVLSFQRYVTQEILAG